MKKLGILLVFVLLLSFMIEAIAEDQITLLGGTQMGNALALSNNYLGETIIGLHTNEGKKSKEWQLEGWYKFSATTNGKCTIRVKEYDGLMSWFNLLDKNGSRLERKCFGGIGPKNTWEIYSFDIKSGESYYLHFESNNGQKTWGYMFSLCLNGKHKTGTEEILIQKATCTEKGLKGYLCSLCNEHIVSNYIQPTGHLAGTETILQEATCLRNGIKGTACKVCGQILSSTEIPVQGHTPGAYVDVQKATCTSDGVRAQYCQVCNATLNTEKVLALGHQSGEWETAVHESCYQAGRREKLCTTCGAILAVEEIPQEEHQYSEWKTILEPTKETEGEQGRICILCGDMQINKIPKIAKFLGIF